MQRKISDSGGSPRRSRGTGQAAQPAESVDPRRDPADRRDRGRHLLHHRQLPATRDAQQRARAAKHRTAAVPAFRPELDNLDAIQRDLVQRMKLTGIATPDAFRPADFRRGRAHRLQVSGQRHRRRTARINIFDANGQLINSSASWPVIRRSTLPTATTSSDSKTIPGRRTSSLRWCAAASPGGWTTVIARKVVAPDGTLVGVVSRGISPASFEAFFESLSLGDGAAISLLHRDGTMLARYPHIEKMIGQNFSAAPVQKLLQQADHRIHPRAKPG